MEHEEEILDTLSEGALLDVAKMRENKRRIKVSDGLYWYDAVVPDTMFDHDDPNQEIDKYCIVRMDRYIVDITRRQVILVGECEVRTLMCLELTVLTPGYVALSEIGKPKYLYYSVLYRDFLEPHRYFNPSARSDHDDGAEPEDKSRHANIEKNLFINRASRSALQSAFIGRREMALFDVKVVASADEVEQLIGYPEPLPTKWRLDYLFPTRIRTSMPESAATDPPSADDGPVVRRRRSRSRSQPPRRARSRRSRRR